MYNRTGEIDSKRFPCVEPTFLLEVRVSRLVSGLQKGPYSSRAPIERGSDERINP
jgi:hypothetical protein